MTEEVKPKRPRGNPNFIKKPKVEETATVGRDESDPVEKESAMSLYDEQAWLKIFCAVLTTYQTSGAAVVKAAAGMADIGLEEFKKRTGK